MLFPLLLPPSPKTLFHQLSSHYFFLVSYFITTYPRNSRKKRMKTRNMEKEKTVHLTNRNLSSLKPKGLVSTKLPLSIPKRTPNTSLKKKKNKKKQQLTTFLGCFHANSNLSNAASLLWHCLHALPFPSNQTNWAGFYVVDPAVPNQLILGPFQGKVACQTIRFGRGVCGVAAKMQETQIVGDVDAFPGHIACDSESKSEIVVPVVQDGKVIFSLSLSLSSLDFVGGGEKRNIVSHLLANSRFLGRCHYRCRLYRQQWL
jgi:L-methionine (R)-S-oxide reductase